MLSSDPCIEIYDETPLLKPELQSSMMIGGYGGGMGGMGGGMGGMGMSGADLMASINGLRATWAEPTGLIEGNGLLISWSLKNKLVAAIDAQASTDWQRIEIDGDAITSPVVGLDMCLFLTRTTAYGYSRKAKAWAKHPLQWNGEQPPMISIGNQLARVTTDDDLLVFTSTGRWFTRNSSTHSEPLSEEEMSSMAPNMVSAEGGLSGMMMGMGPPAVMGAANSSLPSAKDLQITIDLLRASIDGLTKKSEELRTGYKSASDDTGRDQFRKELATIAHQLVTSEIKLQQAEVQLIESKLQRLNLQIAERQARRDELADQQVQQWLSESK